jgi:hypothetical protein
MSSVSYTLLGHEMSLNYTGEKVRADAFYGNTDGLHTLSITANNFTGHVVIEGTLSSSPTENDWFPIKLDWTNKWATFNDVPVMTMTQQDIATDNIGQALYVTNGYTVGNTIVTMNGIVLSDEDFIATDGTNITLVDPAIKTTDILRVVSFTIAGSINDPLDFLTYSAESGTKGYTFRGNYLYIRARVDREYLAASSYVSTDHGRIDKILLNV